jgi:hypothetical protein
MKLASMAEVPPILSKSLKSMQINQINIKTFARFEPI